MARVLLMGALLLVLVIASPATRDAHAQQLVDAGLVNGAFEEGRDTEGWPRNWRVTDQDNPQSPDGNQIMLDAGQGRDDTTAGRLRVGYSKIAEASNTLPDIQPGGTYHLSGWFKVGGLNVLSARLGLEWHVSSTPHAYPVLSTSADVYRATYQRLSMSEAIPCDATALSVKAVLERRDGNTRAFAYIDDLTLTVELPETPCPPPTSPPVPTQPPPGPPGSTPSPSEPPGVPGGPGAPTEPGGVALPRTSLLSNGGFEVAEAGRPAGWRTQGGVLGQVASPVHGGRFAAAFASASDSTKWAYQTVPAQALAWYELDGYVSHNDPRVEGALLRVSWYASADGSGSAISSADSTAELVDAAAGYRYLTTGPVQAPPGARSAKARVLLRPRSSAGAVIYIDDLAFWPTDALAVAAAVERAAASRSGSRSSGGGRSGVLGAAGGSTGDGTYGEQPTPVVRRSERENASAASDGDSSWWPWALVGLAATGAAGYGAYRWRRR
jgi:hypothetical protein